MSENKHTDDDPERTLVTLEQLSQTIEVMTSVVNRLRRHLSEQLKAQAETTEAGADTREQPREEDPVETSSGPTAATEQKRESFVVEIRQQEEIPVPKNGKILH